MNYPIYMSTSYHDVEDKSSSEISLRKYSRDLRPSRLSFDSIGLQGMRSLGNKEQFIQQRRLTTNSTKKFYETSYKEVLQYEQMLKDFTTSLVANNIYKKHQRYGNSYLL